MHNTCKPVKAELFEGPKYLYLHFKLIRYRYYNDNNNISRAWYV